MARNSEGRTTTRAAVKIGDMPEPFQISGIDEDQKIADGDSVTLECGAIIYNYTNDLKWYKDNEPIENATSKSTSFSWRSSLDFENISKDNDGIYRCEVTGKDDNELHTKSLILTVHDAVVPHITTNFNQSLLTQPFGGLLSLDCHVEGLPIPTLEW
jgi:Immunoglobulin domain